MSVRSIDSLINDVPAGRFAGIRRDYGVDQVVSLRGSLRVRAHARRARRQPGSGSCSPPRTMSMRWAR